MGVKYPTKFKQC